MENVEFQKDIKRYQRSIFWLSFFINVFLCAIVLISFYVVNTRSVQYQNQYELVLNKLYTQSLMLENVLEDAYEDSLLWNYDKVITATTYNPEAAQTDSSPCISATNTNICEMKAKGVNIVAMSRDMLWGSGETYCKVDCPFRYGDVVTIESEVAACNIKRAIVLDTMNERFKERIDIFYMDPAKNTKCPVKVKRTF